MVKLSLTLVFILCATYAGFAFQEESGICLPERHAADQDNAKFCHCLDMGGYRYCKEKEDGTKEWSYQDWAADGNKSPQCEMSCKEDNCKCCQWDADYQKKHNRTEILKTYDAY